MRAKGARSPKFWAGLERREIMREEHILAEADLERYGTELLALDGWRSLKTDPVSRKEWGKGFGEKGMCDRLYIRYKNNGDPRFSIHHGIPARPEAEVMWIEWKRIGPGRRAAEKAELHQRIWIDAERRRGALVLLAGEDFPATPEGFFSWYQQSGLMRRQFDPLRKPGA